MDVTAPVLRSQYTSQWTTCRFVLGEPLGEKTRDTKGHERSAAYLTPVPIGAVLYGTGDSARVLTKVPPLHCCLLAVLSGCITVLACC